MKNIRNTRILLAVLNTLGFAAMVYVNYLANALPINGKNTGELSALYPNLFTPAGLTFAIWGVIYLLLAIFTLHQLVSVFKPDIQKSDFVSTIGPFYFLSSLANIGWVFAWHYEKIGISVLLMLALLSCLIIIYRKLGIGVTPPKKFSTRYFIRLPFSVYLGWISIATIANITAFLVALQWGGFGLGDQFWAILMIMIGTGLGATMLLRRSDLPYTLVVIWALVGIVIKRTADTGSEDQGVLITAYIGIAILVLDLAWEGVKKLRK